MNCLEASKQHKILYYCKEWIFVRSWKARVYLRTEKVFLNTYHNLSNSDSSFKLLIKAKAASTEKNGNSSTVDYVTFCQSSSMT